MYGRAADEAGTDMELLRDLEVLYNVPGLGVTLFNE